MTANYEILFRLINKTLFHNEDLKTEDVDWQSLSLELRQHSIYYIPADVVDQLSLSDTDKSEYMESLMKQAAVWKAVLA